MGDEDAYSTPRPWSLYVPLGRELPPPPFPTPPPTTLLRLLAPPPLCVETENPKRDFPSRSDPNAKPPPFSRPSHPKSSALDVLGPCPRLDRLRRPLPPRTPCRPRPSARPAPLPAATRSPRPRPSRPSRPRLPRPPSLAPPLPPSPPPAPASAGSAFAQRSTPPPHSHHHLTPPPPPPRPARARSPEQQLPRVKVAPPTSLRRTRSEVAVRSSPCLHALEATCETDAARSGVAAASCPPV